MKAIFYVELYLGQGDKTLYEWFMYDQDGLHAHMVVKCLKINLCQYQQCDDPESWNGVLRSQILQSIYKWRPLVDLDLLYGKIKFGRICV